MTPSHRVGFTLFEVILAVALSAALLALIGTAINLYLMRIHASRVEVEEAQLARTILGRIAADIRAATIYQPQDTSGIAQLMAAASQFDVDSIDDPIAGGSGIGSGSGSSASSGTPVHGAGSSGESTSQQVLPLGLNGTVEELIIDVNRLPGPDELFSLVTGYTNFPSAAGGASGNAATAMATPNQRPSDLKTARYFVRKGNFIDPGGMDATQLAPEAQFRASGLVRQEIDRAVRSWAEQSGNQSVLEMGQMLLAPEVVRLEFYYFDGMQVTNYWDMRQRNALPLAIEVRLWLVSADDLQSMQMSDTRSLLAKAREYRQTVFLPMAAAANARASSTGRSPSTEISAPSFGDEGFGFSD